MVDNVMAIGTSRILNLYMWRYNRRLWLSFGRYRFISVVNGNELGKDVKICKSNEEFVTVVGEVCRPTTQGKVDLQVTIPKFQIIPKRILNYTFLLGKGWLKLNWVQLKLPWEFKTELKPRSQTAEFPNNRKGSYYVNKKKLYCAECIEESGDEKNVLLVLNLNEEKFNSDKLPELSRWDGIEGKYKAKWCELLKDKFRLEYFN